MSVVKKQKKKISEEDLDSFTKEELIDRVRQLIAHNKQLKNVISKKIQSESNSEGTSKKERRFDFTKCSKRHIFLKLLYLGWDYQGFATQEDTNKTIEWELFEALKKSCLIDERATSNYHRCGRTDKGVSAFGQVISIDVRSRALKQPVNENFCENTDKGVSVSNREPLKPNCTSSINTESDNIESELEYCKILNRLLPQQIRAIAWSPVSPEESARFNCRKRTYKYFFPRGNLNLKNLKEAASYLVGEHDFRNFCKMDVANGVVNFQRKIHSASVDVHSYDQRIEEFSKDCHVSIFDGVNKKEGDISINKGLKIDGEGKGCDKLIMSSDVESIEEGSAMDKDIGAKKKIESPYDMCELTVVGQAFLWHQIRCIVSVLFLVGQGKEEPGVVRHLLDVDSFPRKPQYCLASELPLNLFFTEFDSSLNWVYDRECISSIIRSLQKEWTMLSVKTTMVREMIKELEEFYDEIEGSELTNCLYQGVKPRAYIPLLQRNTCESLEDRINHFVKRKRIELEEETE